MLTTQQKNRPIRAAFGKAVKHIHSYRRRK